MRETDLAYLAGLMDGEGSISLSAPTRVKTKSGRPAQSPTLVVQISMTAREPLDWIAGLFGGNVVVTYRPARPHHRTCYGWRARGRRAAHLLQMILPYLKVKHQQAMLGIAAQAQVRPSRKLGDVEMARRFALRDQMLALNGTTARATVPSAADW